MAESKGESKGTTKPPVFSFGYLHIHERWVAGPNCLLWNLRYIFFHFGSTIWSKTNICVSFLCSLHFKGPGKNCFNKAILTSQLNRPASNLHSHTGYSYSFPALNQEARWLYQTDWKSTLSMLQMKPASSQYESKIVLSPWRKIKLTIVGRLFDSEHFSDCIIKCGNRVWKLHRSILASRSSYFEAMFNFTFPVRTAANLHLGLY